jgi:phage-related protein
MAVKKENLTVEVVLDSKGAVKEFRHLNKEILSVGGGVDKMAGATRGGEKALGSYSASAKSATAATDQYYASVLQANEAGLVMQQTQGNIAQQNAGISSSFTALSSSISSVVDMYNLFTSPESLARISKMARVAALFADVKGFDKTADSLRRVSDQTLEFSVSGREAEMVIDAQINKYADLDRTLEGVKDGIDGLLLGTGLLAAVPFSGALATQTKAAVDLGSALYKTSGSFAASSKESAAFVANLGNFKTAGKEAVDFLASGFGRIRDVVPLVAKDMMTLGGQARNVGEIAKTVSKAGFLSMAEASLTAGTAFGALGAVLTSFDSTGAKVTGTILVIAAALTGAFGVAVNMALGFVGRLIESLGDKMISAMEQFEAKALKLQMVMQQFTFTVKGFNKVYGSEAVGSLKMWEQALEDTVETTTFARDETAKAIKLLVAEGKTLGLSVQDTTQLFEKSKDIAAATGNTLDDVINRLIAGLAGNSQAVLALGINTSETALNQLELVKATGKTVSALSDQDKIMARLQEVFVATKPIAGAAAAAVGTVAGAYAILEKRLNEVQAKLGEQGTFTTLYLTAFSKIAGAFLALPPSVIDAVGALQDFFGVVFKIGGVIIQYTLTIVALTTAYSLLTAAVAKYALIQAGLTSVFGFIGTALGVQTVQVTTLTAVWTNLGIVLRGSVLVAFQYIGTALLAFAKGIGAALIAIAPLALKIGAIVVAIVALIEGFKVLEEETGIFREIGQSIASAFSAIGVAVLGTSVKVDSSLGLMTKAVRVLTAVGAGAAAFIASSILLVNESILRLFQLVTSFSDTLSGFFGNAADWAAEKINKLSMVAAKSGVVIASLGTQSAFASDEFNKSAKESEAYKITLEALAKASANLADKQRELAVAQASGNTEAAMLLEKQILGLQVAASKEGEEREKLVTQFIQAQVGIQKAFSDGVKAADKQALEARKQMLSGLNDESSVKELIKVRKELEGRDIRDQILKFKVLADESGASEVIAKLEKNLVQLENSIEEGEWSKFREELSKEQIERSAQAVKSLNDVFESTSATLIKSRADLKAFKDESSDREAELNAQLEIIEQRKNEAVFFGQNVALAIRQAEIAERNARENYEVVTALQLAKDIRQADLNAAKMAADFATEQAKANEAGFEAALQQGMSLAEIHQRQLQIELDGIEAKREALRLSGALSSEAEYQLDVASKLAQQKSAQTAPSAIQNVAGAVTDAVGSASPVGGFMAAAEAIVGAIQKLIDFIPNILNAVTRIFTSLADLPIAIMKAIQNLISGIGKFISTFIPNLIQAIPQIISDLLTAVFETFPALVQDLVQSLPSLIDGFLERVPDLISRFVEGLVSSSDTIALGLVGGIIQNLPKFFSAFVMFMPRLYIALAQGVITGIMNGLKNLWKNLTGLFSGVFPSLGKGIGAGVVSGIQDNLQKISGATAQLFQVGEDSEAAQKAQDTVKAIQAEAANIGRTIWEKFKELVLQFWGWIKSIGGAIWDGLVALAKGQWDFLLSMGRAIWEGLKSMTAVSLQFAKDIGIAIWDSLKATALLGWNFIKDIGSTIWESFKLLFTNPGEAVKTFAKGIWDAFSALLTGGMKIFENLGGGLGRAVMNAVGGIFDGAKKLFDLDIEGLKSAFSGIGDSLMSPLKTVIDGFKGSINKFIDILNGLKIPEVGWSISAGRLGSWSGTLFPGVDLIPGPNIPRFAQGGLVEGIGYGDTVDAKVAPGEFVMRREAVRGYGEDLMQRLNSGTANMQGSQNLHVEIRAVTIQTTQAMDGDFVKNKVVPTLREEILKASQRGEFVLAKKGIR